MRLFLKIDTDDQPQPDAKLAAILRDLAGAAERGEIVGRRVIRDTDGTDLGHWETDR